jgi:hypothetical protein
MPHKIKYYHLTNSIVCTSACWTNFESYSYHFSNSISRTWKKANIFSKSKYHSKQFVQGLSGFWGWMGALN